MKRIICSLTIFFVVFTPAVAQNAATDNMIFQTQRITEMMKQDMYRNDASLYCPANAINGETLLFKGVMFQCPYARDENGAIVEREWRIYYFLADGTVMQAPAPSSVTSRDSYIPNARTGYSVRSKTDQSVEYYYNAPVFIELGLHGRCNPNTGVCTYQIITYATGTK
jgi:hypothetical protein